MKNNTLTLTQAADKYKTLTVHRLRQLCQDGKVKAEKLNPRLWLLSEKSLQKYLASDRKPGPKRATA